MTVKELERQQKELLPKEDLAPYAGQWVALRNGYVIAHDIDAAALRAQPEVTSEDVIIPVPAGEAGYFVA